MILRRGRHVVSVAVAISCAVAAGCATPATPERDASTQDRSSAATTSGVTAIGTDTDVTFTSDGITVHASVRLPVHPSGLGVPAALILAGSGPTDRNGNSAIAGVPRIDNLRQVADTLASNGVASIRYDKVGTGATGLGGRTVAQVAAQGFGVLIDEAVAADSYLAHAAGVDPTRTALVGHSEGALVALAATRSGRIGSPAGLALLEPAPLPILDVLSIQLRESFAAALAKSAITAAQAAALDAELTRAIASIRADATVPPGLSPVLTRVGLNATQARGLQDEDRLDPRTLAAGLPSQTSVLTTCSDADTQVTCGEVAGVDAAARHTQLGAVHLTTAMHTLQATAGGPLTPPFIDAFVRWVNATLHP